MTADDRHRPAAGGRRPADDAAGAEDRSPTARVISDPRTMRAVAHPVRLALLEALGREGELTATRAGELLAESPGNMSWHLQTLAKYGYIEEAGGGKGRSRPWRLTAVSSRFRTAADDPAAHAANDALGSVVADQAYSRLREWFGRRAAYSPQWRDAAFAADALTYLTAEEMSELSDEITSLLGRYQERVLDKRLRPADAEPVKLIAFGHPIEPSPSGN